jgi:hypothetical protein
MLSKSITRQAYKEIFICCQLAQIRHVFYLKGRVYPKYSGARRTSRKNPIAMKN